ncbi:MAG: hypothetical protein WB586_09170 [Chthoniobacterales bacterium]
MPFTAKDFRTWAGTVLAAIALGKMEAVDSKAKAKKNVVTAIEAVARMLGNTAAICRKFRTSRSPSDCGRRWNHQPAGSRGEII